MSDADGYASVEDYFAEFRDLLRRELPEELPGSTAIATLVGDYVATDKRSIILFIKTGPTTVLSVRYKMPVPAAGAKIFGLAGLVPHEGPTFSAITEAEIAGRVAAANVRPWAEEIARLLPKQNEGDERHRRAVRNILTYWRMMRRYLTHIYNELGVKHPGRASSLARTLSAASEPRQPTPRPNSDPAHRLTSTLEAPRSSSSSRRRRVSRRRSANARVGPRRFSGKPTSDPTRRRRRRSA